MRRADRLFQLIQILQRQDGIVTADKLAEEMELSERTIYRYIQDLIANRVPIKGERGVGYMLDKGYDMPPLMFTEEEIDALMLGASWVVNNGDPHIKRAASDILKKVEAVLPADRRSLMQKARQVVPIVESAPEISISMPEVRQAIREQKKARTKYVREDGAASERILYPLLTVFFQNIQLLVCWCELRQSFRNFRMDRFQEFEMLEEGFPANVARDLDVYLKRQRQATEENQT
ncbi:HTH domain-containing protein [Sneathiella sp. P13V-1]|uniref:helix-turn-helix transcriptional regulator n=1 Tax=Sneathiella sp. P13V-1 TaxID=2697366 RepID=UPI00187B8866|nr:YafY family protein [Sneathiella sp. P13V-1]MBE7636110.1 HTH domain-containing protein [Sneathiella sp. P13V-1]